jgi:imidazolonepropionase-like amidohydrolase
VRRLSPFLLLAASLVGSCGPSGHRVDRPVADGQGEWVAFVGATVATSPDAAPIRDGIVLLHGRKIAAVGPRGAVEVPRGAREIDARGTTITAGFWNAHVHFAGPAFADVAHAPAPTLAGALSEMLGRWGFAHVFDTGSDIRQTAVLKARIERGEVVGPSVRTTGAPFVAVGGQPVYIPFPLPQLPSPAAAIEMVRAELDHGADGIKLMTASVVANPPPPVMPVPIVRAVTETAHARGVLVFAHPTNRDGVIAARDGGVDVLAHTAPASGPWSAEDARALVAAKMSLVPTLSLWRLELTPISADLAERYERDAIEQVRAFAAAGGTLLFGTDVGYRPEVDTTAEHTLLACAGLSFAAHLAMLTTAPAARFGARQTGTIAPSMNADLVVLEGDATTDPAAFAHVRCTLRDGVVIFAAAAARCR